MDLEDLIAALILPKDEKSYSFNLVGIVRHFATKPKVPTEQITAGAIETLREMQELNEAGEKHEDSGFDILKSIAKWGFKKIVKFVLRLAFRLMLNFARWIFREILVNGIKALVEWVVRPLLMEALGFIGVNPELWPFIAIGGGVVALGYTGWKMFFSKSKDSTPSKIKDASAESLAATREAADAAVTSKTIYETRPAAPTTEVAGAAVPVERAAPTTAARGQRMVKAEAPMPAGAPVEVPTGTDKDIMAMIQRHEGFKQRPYKDSLGLWTIGVGHLIGDGKSLPAEWDREFSLEEIQKLFAGDYIKHKMAAMKIPGFDTLNSSGQAALIDITYNMGPTWWHRWPTFTKDMQAHDIAGAAASLEDSKWYTQVGARAREVVGLLKSGAGKDQTQVASADTVQQTPPVTMAKASTPGAAQQGIAVGGTAPTTQASNVTPMRAGSQVASSSKDKNYINGPRGSLIAVG